jgi:ankyrin repeat protein
MQDEDGDTPLIQACYYGHVETARVLLDHRASVDQQDNVSTCSRQNMMILKCFGSNIQIAMSTINLL